MLMGTNLLKQFVMSDKNEIKAIIYAGAVILVPMIMILIYLILR